MVFFASNKRSAIRLRKRVIGTRFSERELYATVLIVFCSVATSCFAFCASRFATSRATSSRVIRPPTPEP